MVEKLLSLEKIKEQVPKEWRNICEYAIAGYCRQSKEIDTFRRSCANGDNCLLRCYLPDVLFFN